MDFIDFLIPKYNYNLRLALDKGFIYFPYDPHHFGILGKIGSLSGFCFLSPF
jgi:hypothetical protein